MEKVEGSKLVVIPVRAYYSCMYCKYYEHSMVRSGLDPLYAYNCRHPKIKDNVMYFNPHHGNLNGSDVTPDWCPVEITGTNNPNEIPDLNNNTYAHFVDDNNVIHGDLNDEEIKHEFVDGKLKWFVDYENEKVYLHPVYYIDMNKNRF